MSLLLMEEFTTCFRKQFIFQKGKGGMRQHMYYTALNNEMKLKNDHWGMIVFIHCAHRFQFTDKEIQKELRIRGSLYEELKENEPLLIKDNAVDKKLYLVLKAKIALVKNSVKYKHKVVMDK